MKKRICVLTATRAEYGLLKPIIAKLNNIPELDLRIAVTGMHLSPEFGLTYREIEKDNFIIDRKIDIGVNSDSHVSVSKSMGLALIGFAKYFDEIKPDMLLVLGDRYETLAVCCAAMNAGIPIAHLYGGETTEGAIDESIRHSITKMSYLHFTSTEEYRKRVIQLGEEPDRVYTVGAIGVENIMNTQLLPLKELEEFVGMSLSGQFAVVTYHPVTLENDSIRDQFASLLKACDIHNELKYIFTKANADLHGRIINLMIDDYARNHENVAAVTSLGMERYLSALGHASLVIGNSSSGLIEAPSFHIPTVNIGNRQKGRLLAESVISCEADSVEITKAITKALSEEFRLRISDIKNPYGNGNTSDKVIETLKNYLFVKEINLKKSFYNINISI
ncbi:MAG: UDP-N-acetylglucosamine 2-epimerase (hydrolyzing) [Anaerolineaceae bacterium]|nr:MAG: UDP-N-acetylglucosamine 2-epimerase (hydrolyzing) [Anaerolineaceae bacterium]